jgi:hypothetical protein
MEAIKMKTGLLAVLLLHLSMGMVACGSQSPCEEANSIAQNCAGSTNPIGYDFNNCDEFTEKRAECLVYFGQEVVCSTLSGKAIEGTQEFNQCLATGMTPDEEENNEEENENNNIKQDCSDIPKVQGLSQTCCMDYGIDACGAGLVCAALDGRTIPTCYAEYSRLSGSECSDDRQCISQSCNLAAKACRYMSGEVCTPNVGCTSVSDPNQEMHCTGSTRYSGLDQDLTCHAVSSKPDPEYGMECKFCTRDSDCGNSACDTDYYYNDVPLTLICRANRCVGPSGTYVKNDKCCLNGDDSYSGCYECE